MVIQMTCEKTILKASSILTYNKIIGAYKNRRHFGSMACRRTLRVWKHLKRRALPVGPMNYAAENRWLEWAWGDESETPTTPEAWEGWRTDAAEQASEAEQPTDAGKGKGKDTHK